MSAYIDFDVSVEDINQNLEEEEDNEVINSYNDSLKSFIDDKKIEGDRTFYRKFKNVTASTDDVLKQKYDKSMADI